MISKQKRLKTIIREQWWLMDCDLPDLNWARLRVYQDNSAEIFAQDGIYQFLQKFLAIEELEQDEYINFDEMSFEEKLEMSLCSIQPPSGRDEQELLGQMYVKNS